MTNADWEADRMKIGGTSFFALSILWILVSLLWFFWVKSTVIGVIWLIIGIVQLAIALVSRNRKK